MSRRRVAVCPGVSNQAKYVWKHTKRCTQMQPPPIVCLSIRDERGCVCVCVRRPPAHPPTRDTAHIRSASHSRPVRLRPKSSHWKAGRRRLGPQCSSGLRGVRVSVRAAPSPNSRATRKRARKREILFEFISLFIYLFFLQHGFSLCVRLFGGENSKEGKKFLLCDCRRMLVQEMKMFSDMPRCLSFVTIEM